MAHTKDTSAKIQKIATEARTKIDRIAADALKQIKAVQAGEKPTSRSSGVSTRRRIAAKSSRVLVTTRSSAKAPAGFKKPAPVQSGVLKALMKRKRGLTTEALMEITGADKKAVQNATFNLKRKGMASIERNGRGPGIWRLQALEAAE